MRHFLAFVLLLPVVSGFYLKNLRDAGVCTTRDATSLAAEASSDVVELRVDMPPRGSGLQASLKVKPVLPAPSEMVEVRYNLPFGLDVAPKQGLAVCTKEGPGGEQVGDVLRYTSQWSIGLPAGSGLVSQAAAFSGGVSWQCTMFNVLNAGSWDEVVSALTSNVESRTDEVVLIFERPLGD